VEPFKSPHRVELLPRRHFRKPRQTCDPINRTRSKGETLRGCLKSPDSVIFHRLSFPIPASKQLGRTLVRAVSLDLPGLFKHLLIAEACNIGLEPLVRNEVPALRRSRLSWVNQNFVRNKTITEATASLVAAQNNIPLVHTWGGGEVASADGLRFVVPVRTSHAGPNPKFHPEFGDPKSPPSISLTRGYKRDAAMGRNKRRHLNARSDVLSGGVPAMVC
jgi:hypothetical protein